MASLPQHATLFQRLFGNTSGKLVLGVILGAAVVVPLLNQLPESSPFHVPTFVVSLLGKYLCTRSWRWPSISSGAIAAFSAWDTARSSPSAATPWACT